MMQRIRAFSELLNRYSWISKAGLTFGGDRDLLEVLGYQKNLKVVDYRERYRRNGVAARVVEAYPKSTWRARAEVVEVENPNRSTAFEKAWVEFEQQHKIWSTLLRADILSGLGHYAVLLIGARGNGILEAPLPKELEGPDDILYFHPYDAEEATIEEFDGDPKSERFGLPKFYRIRRESTSGARGRKTLFDKKIHWSRILHIADGTLDDQVYGQPRLERVWNLLDDLEKVTGGGAEAFWKRADQGLHFDIDKELEATPDDIDKMKDQVDEFIHGYRRFLLSRGSKIEMFGSDTANFDKNVDAIILQISTATGIPRRVLTGSELGELASTQDRSTWAERIQDRRDEWAKPNVIQPLIDRMVDHGVLPRPKRYDVLWPEIRSLTEMERANVAAKWGALNRQTGDIVVSGAEIRTRVLGLEPMEEAERQRLQEQLREPEPQASRTPDDPREDEPASEPTEPRPRRRAAQEEVA